MPNPLYEQMMGNAQYPVQPQQTPPMSITQAMANPAAFVKQRFPDIPKEIENDPSQIFQYLLRTRGQPPMIGGMRR